MKTGIDIIEIDRFKNIASDIKKLKVAFTDKEIEYFKKYNFNLEHIAGTFSAKEAVCKAFKTGFNGKIRLLDIEILHQDGVPYVHLLGEAKVFFEQNGFKNIDISISHDRSSAISICVID